MARPLAKSPFVLLALGLWILACPASQSDDDEFNLLNQQGQTLYKQGKYQEAIPLAEKAVEIAKRVYGPEQPNPANGVAVVVEIKKPPHGFSHDVELIDGAGGLCANPAA